MRIVSFRDFDVDNAEPIVLPVDTREAAIAYMRRAGEDPDMAAETFDLLQEAVAFFDREAARFAENHERRRAQFLHDID